MMELNKDVKTPAGEKVQTTAYCLIFVWRPALRVADVRTSEPNAKGRLDNIEGISLDDLHRVRSSGLIGFYQNSEFGSGGWEG